MSMNNVSLVGRLTADVDLRYTNNGVAVGNFMLACNRPFKNAQGEQEADFIRCTIWREQAENLANYMKKGHRIGVTGRIQTGHYQDADDKRIYTTDVVVENAAFLETKATSGQGQGQAQSQGQGNQNTQGQQQSTQAGSQAQGQGAPIDISDDDLPF